MTPLKHCPTCSAIITRDEVAWEFNQIRCAYCCNMEGGEPGCRELTSAEFDALDDYVEPDFNLNMWSILPTLEVIKRSRDE